MMHNVQNFDSYLSIFDVVARFEPKTSRIQNYSVTTVSLPDITSIDLSIPSLDNDVMFAVFVGRGVLRAIKRGKMRYARVLVCFTVPLWCSL
jgi:hypothetical protein